jgi:protein involved in polysaccharide export with SLBB domain
MGRDPALADRYFDAMARGTASSQPTSGDVVSSMQAIGVMLRDTIPGGRADSVIDLTAPVGARLGAGGLPVFGRDLFRVATSQFQAVGNGPVDPGYRLGPGDQLVAVLTGDVQLSYTLDVSREGMIAIPDVGQVYVAGLTLRELEDLLYERLGRVYSGVGRGQGATTQFTLSMGQLRTSQVFIIGEAERPGAYQVSSVSTMFNALYLARGPNDNGSFRRIELRRGGQVVRTVDVYDYLLGGDSRDDVRLEQGDVIYIPLAGVQVGIQGSVRREAIFELKPGEGLRELLGYAGGLNAEASLARLQIDRVLPPGQRRPGVERGLIDVNVEDFLAGRVTPQLFDRDRISVFAVSAERRNRVVLAGEVQRPGVYEWQPGTSLWALIDRAEGLNEDAYTARAHVYRYNPEDGSRSLIRAPLFAGDVKVRSDIILADRDSIVVYSRSDLRNPELVAVTGFVKRPGYFPLAEGMTARDLILAAGGFTAEADQSVAELARRSDPRRRTNETARLYYLPLGDQPVTPLLRHPGLNPAPGDTTAAASASRGAGEWLPSAVEMPLQNGDVIFIRRAPGYQAERLVFVGGEVAAPGGYALQTRSERLVEVVQRAGGTTPEAYLPGARVLRRGLPVATDFIRAAENPRGRYNIILEVGDSITVPSYDPTVLVTGAVNFESRVLFDPRLSLADYVSRAGGYAENAHKSRVSVRYPNGEIHSVQSALVFARVPQVRPGSVVIVPAKAPAERSDLTDRMTRIVSILPGAPTLWIAIDRLTQ